MMQIHLSLHFLFSLDILVSCSILSFLEKMFFQKNHRKMSHIKKTGFSCFFLYDSFHPLKILRILFGYFYHRNFRDFIRMIFLNKGNAFFFFFSERFDEEYDFLRWLYLSFPKKIWFYPIDTIHAGSRFWSQKSLNKFLTFTRFIWVGGFKKKHKGKWKSIVSLYKKWDKMKFFCLNLYCIYLWFFFKVLSLSIQECFS